MYLAIDIGATKTLIALFSRRGRIVKKKKFSTAQNSKTFLNDLRDNLKPFQKSKVNSVVVAVPGIVQKNCTIRFGNRNWGDLDLLIPIKSLFSCQIYFENDGNLATIYEGYRLAGRTVFLTFSTGVGGGIVENGRLITSEFEPGHKVYTYNNRSMEWEDIAAASALEKFYHVNHATDLRGKQTLKDIAARIYLGLPDIVKEYHPNTIIIGGPMGKIFRLYGKYLPKIKDVRYKKPKRPTESVIYGCYMYAKKKEQG